MPSLKRQILSTRRLRLCSHSIVMPLGADECVDVARRSCRSPAVWPLVTFSTFSKHHRRPPRVHVRNSTPTASNTRTQLDNVQNRPHCHRCHPAITRSRPTIVHVHQRPFHSLSTNGRRSNTSSGCLSATRTSPRSSHRHICTSNARRTTTKIDQNGSTRTGKANACERATFH